MENNYIKTLDNFLYTFNDKDESSIGRLLDVIDIKGLSFKDMIGYRPCKALKELGVVRFVNK